jgi:hypothetical protein
MADLSLYRYTNRALVRRFTANFSLVKSNADIGWLLYHIIIHKAQTVIRNTARFA